MPRRSMLCSWPSAVSTFLLPKGCYGMGFNIWGHAPLHLTVSPWSSGRVFSEVRRLRTKGIFSVDLSGEPWRVRK